MISILIGSLAALGTAFYFAHIVTNKTPVELTNEYHLNMDVLQAAVEMSVFTDEHDRRTFDLSALSELIDSYGTSTDVNYVSFRYVTEETAFHKDIVITLKAPAFFVWMCGVNSITFNKPLIVDGEYFGLLTISMSPNRLVNEAWDQYLLVLGSVVALLVFVLLGMALVLYRSLRPLKILASAGEQVVRGDLSVRVPVTGTPELQIALSTFNKVTEGFQEMLAALRESESRFRQLAELLPQLVWTSQPDGSCDYLNRKWLEFTGVPEQEQRGRGWLKQIHADDYNKVLAEWDTATRSGDEFRVESRIREANGEYRWFDMHAVALRGLKGTVVKWFGSSVDITEHKRVEMALRDSQKQLSFVLEGSNLGFWDWDIQAGKVDRNSIWAEMLGYTFEEIARSVAQWSDYIHPEDVASAWQSIQSNLEGRTTQHEATYRMRTKEGDYKWILDRAKVVERNHDGVAVRMAGTHSDITLQKIAENELKIAATAFESQEGIMITDAEEKILRVNNAFVSITGYSKKETLGRHSNLLRSGKHDVRFFRSMWDSIHSAGTWEGEIWNRRKDGEIYPEYLNITAVKDDSGIVTNYVGTFIDLTKNKAASEQIRNLAFYDPLTQLPNRQLLVSLLDKLLVSNTQSNNLGALLFIDLDHFKLLNDTLGHEIGDVLLKRVATRLRGCVSAGDTVARLGGDEFVVLLPGLSEEPLAAAAEAETIGAKILDSLNQDYQLNSHTYYNSASIGATLFHGSEHKVGDILKHADIAMYDAKRAGRNNLRFFDPVMQEAIDVRAEMVRDLRTAVDQQEFQLYYQMQVDGAGRPLGAEVLIRWNHSTRGMVSPLSFIPLAEQTDLILPIGEWSLRVACSQLKRWESNPYFRHLTLSINVSAKQFHHVEFVDRIKTTISQHQVNPQLIQLEITESMLLENIDTVIEKMQDLRSFGIRFELDDFGTGYSSLQYLKKLPIDKLKIDQSFVRDITEDESDRSIVRTIITMAKSLNLGVIAEGVEIKDQQKFLLDNGCDHCQGYLYGRPTPIDEFEKSLMKLFEKRPASTA